MNEWDAMGIELSENEKMLFNKCIDEFCIGVEHIASVFREFGESMAEALDEIVYQIIENLPDVLRRKWPIPQDDRIKPLMMDRRQKLYRCRNNC